MVSFEISNEELTVNSRIKVGRDYGTIKYIGEVILSYDSSSMKNRNLHFMLFFLKNLLFFFTD